MARYAHLFAEASEELGKTKAALAKAEHDRETYRRFIHENGHTEAYMLWWARDQGFTGETMEMIERAFAANLDPPTNGE